MYNIQNTQMTTTYSMGHIKTVAIMMQDNRSCEQPCSCCVFLTFFKLKRKPEQDGTQISGTSQKKYNDVHHLLDHFSDMPSSPPCRNVTIYSQSTLKDVIFSIF